MTPRESATAKRMGAVAQRARSLWPASRKVGEYAAREARRRAPRGTGVTRRGGTALNKSLNHAEPAHNVTVVVSDLPYAKVQNQGGTIVAGSGRLKSKYLALPMSDLAERYIGFLGAGTSLRSGPLGLFVLKVRGRLFLVRSVGLTERGKTRTDRRGRTRHTRVIKHGMGTHRLEFLFELRRRVTIRAQRYVPSLREPGMRRFSAETVQRYLSTGRA